MVLNLPRPGVGTYEQWININDEDAKARDRRFLSAVGHSGCDEAS